jgi:hypothetical protein
MAMSTIFRIWDARDLAYGALADVSSTEEFN